MSSLRLVVSSSSSLADADRAPTAQTRAAKRNRFQRLLVGGQLGQVALHFRGEQHADLRRQLEAVRRAGGRGRGRARPATGGTDAFEAVDDASPPVGQRHDERDQLLEVQCSRDRVAAEDDARLAHSILELLAQEDRDRTGRDVIGRGKDQIDTVVWRFRQRDPDVKADRIVQRQPLAAERPQHHRRHVRGGVRGGRRSAPGPVGHGGVTGPGNRRGRARPAAASAGPDRSAAARHRPARSAS